MQLNSIEIKGFKSFADNTVLKFNEKVTGVVGPNGSGKSNVVDAIRWVLGEQKPTELRLERMTDLTTLKICLVLNINRLLYLDYCIAQVKANTV